MAKRIRTPRTIRAATGFLSVHERGGAADLDHLDALAGFDDAVLVEGAGGPDLAFDLRAADALLVGDALEDHRVAPDERGGARAHVRGHLEMTAGDGPHEGQQ